MRLIKSQSAHLTTKASFWIMGFLHLPTDTTKLEVPSVTLQTDRSVFQNVCTSLVSPTTVFGKLFHFFFCLDYSNSYDSSSIVTRPFSPVVPPLPPLIWTLSRRITARQRNLVAFCMICSKHYVLLVSCGKSKNFLCVKSNFNSSYIFIGL